LLVKEGGEGERKKEVLNLGKIPEGKGGVLKNNQWGCFFFNAL